MTSCFCGVLSLLLLRFYYKNQQYSHVVVRQLSYRIADRDLFIDRPIVVIIIIIIITRRALGGAHYLRQRSLCDSSVRPNNVFLLCLTVTVLLTLSFYSLLSSSLSYAPSLHQSSSKSAVVNNVGKIRIQMPHPEYDPYRSRN